MLKKLNRKLYFLFVRSIMFVFTIVFFLLIRENIETMQNAELNFISSDYAFRLFTEQNELLYESSNIEDTTKTIDTFLGKLKNSEITYEDETESSHSFQSGIITFPSENGRTYHGVLCSIYTDTGYVNLVIVKEKSGLTAFLPTITYYLLIWLVVLIAVLFVSVLIIKQAMKPTEKAMQSQKNFIAAVSHELRTPLAVLQSTTDAIETSPDCTTSIKDNIFLIQTEISRMAKLIQDLILLSSIDAGNCTFHKSAIYADTLLIDQYEKFEYICHKKSIDLQIEMPEECFPPLSLMKTI